MDVGGSRKASTRHQISDSADGRPVRRVLPPEDDGGTDSAPTDRTPTDGREPAQAHTDDSGHLDDGAHDAAPDADPDGPAPRPRRAAYTRRVQGPARQAPGQAPGPAGTPPATTPPPRAPAPRAAPPARPARSHTAGFDLYAWLTAPRHRSDLGVYGYGRDEQALRLAATDARARRRPSGALVRRAVLWLLIALLGLPFITPWYAWLTRTVLPTFLEPLFVGNLYYFLFFASVAYFGRWHEIAAPYVRPVLERMRQRAGNNGRPRPEQIRRAVFFALVSFVAWTLLMKPFVELLLLVFPRGRLHDLQWLVRLVYNGAFLAAAAWGGRWHALARPYIARPGTGPVPLVPLTGTRTAARTLRPAAVDPDDLWPELHTAGFSDAADILDREADAGRLSDVDYLRLRRVLEAGQGDADYLADVADEIRGNGAAACPHGSGLRDLKPRRTEHDLLTAQVRIGATAEHERNPDTHKGVDIALDPDTLGGSLLLTGPAGAGESASVLRSVVESASLRALAGQTSLVVLDTRGDALLRDGAYDVEIVVGDPDSPWGLELYGAGAGTEESADRLAAAAIPAHGPGGDRLDGARVVLRRLLAAYTAGYGGYPALGRLLDLLDGDPQALRALGEALEAKGESAGHERALRTCARRDEPAQLLVQRLSALESPGIAELFDPARERFAMRQTSRPVRVHVALHGAAHPEAAGILGRLLTAQFVHTATARRSRRTVFAQLVVDGAGRCFDDHTVQGLHWVRTHNASIVVSVRALADFPEELRGAVLNGVGCVAVTPGADVRDTEFLAEHWGKVEREVEASRTTGNVEGSVMRRARFAVTGALFGPKAAGRLQRVTTHLVERYRWSPAEISTQVPARHLLMSLTGADGTRTDPVLVELTPDPPAGTDRPRRTVHTD